ncbi:MAG: S8 family serine peptidase [Candidatus Eisenbacteria bacterium]|uniref:S8 family serine peptidase n=1 Tax=Eiseniibacteriota bacterium TaxID=2212470 RepID=A0A956N852_UNCEI|nr:S8 family serine peptidase [Candidatus Eisenbacteria bacterium]MCB9466241.1 S8 family serine peptidase [Candidatus Eisenbacteria bacterium]
MRRLLLGAFAMAGLCATMLTYSASAATLHPAVEAEINNGSFDESMSVLVYLQEAPIQQLSADLSEQGATRKARHTAIIDALQEQQRTQDPLKAWLESEMPSGKVDGYTSYWIMNCLVIEATKGTILEIANRPEVERIEPNWQAELMEPVDGSAPMDEIGGSPRMTRGAGFVPPGLRAIKADQVWYQYGITGAGRLIGGLDTGVDGNHPALASRWRGVTEPSSECWLDVLGTNTTFPNDGNSHGTHTMGTMTGNSPTTLDTVGVAWGAKWIAANAINQGVGSAFDNDVIACFQWFMNPDGDSQTMDDVPDVVQNSWRINEQFGGNYTDCDTRWWNAIDNCEAAGVVVVFSAGNEGPGAGTIGSPPDRATTEYNAFSVGAVDATNFNAPYPIASFSSRGPSGCNVSAELKIKPEVAAPGVDVYSTIPGGGYSSAFSGTSMAGPHVSGIVPLLREADPNLEVDEIKQILMETAIDYGATGNDNTYGYGFVDALAAVESALVGFGNLEGFVGNASFGNAPISGATVTVIEEDRSFVTDTDGTYGGLVPPGTFTVEASHPSFASQQFQVEVLSGQPTVQNFSLTDIAGPTITNLSDPLTTSDDVGPYAMTADISDASTVASARLYYRVNGGTWQFVNMTGSGTYSGSIPGQDAGSIIDFYAWAQDGIGLEATFPADAPASYHTLYVTQVVYAYDVESNDANWSLSAAGDNATTGLWVRADPIGTDSGGPIQSEDDHTPAPGVICFVTGNSGSGAGDDDVDNGCTTLTSPVFDLAGAELAFVSYARWFMMGGASADDVFQIDVSNDGGSSWQSLETVTAFEPAWNVVTFELSGVIALTDQMRFRFIACDINTQGLTECEIDDFSIEAFIPANPADVDDIRHTVQVSSLETNAPNPMNSSTTLRFNLSNASDAALTIYDASGRLVRSLWNGPLASGVHQLNWDGRDDRGTEVEAGVYFYRLEAGAFTQSRRLLVVR